jgi:hypothetical protein
MNAVEKLTGHLLGISKKKRLEYGTFKRTAAELTSRSEAFTELVESALSKPREDKVLIHVWVVRMMVLKYVGLSVDLEPIGIKVQAAGVELDFTVEIHHRDAVSYIRVSA